MRGLKLWKGWSTAAHADSSLSASQGGTTSQAVLQQLQGNTMTAVVGRATAALRAEVSLVGGGAFLH